MRKSTILIVLMSFTFSLTAFAKKCKIKANHSLKYKCAAKLVDDRGGAFSSANYGTNPYHYSSDCECPKAAKKFKKDSLGVFNKLEDERCYGRIWSKDDKEDLKDDRDYFNIEISEGSTFRKYVIARKARCH